MQSFRFYITTMMTTCMMNLLAIPTNAFAQTQIVHLTQTSAIILPTEECKEIPQVSSLSAAEPKERPEISGDYQSGKWNGNTYINTWADYQITLPENCQKESIDSSSFRNHYDFLALVPKVGVSLRVSFDDIKDKSPKSDAAKTSTTETSTTEAGTTGTDTTESQSTEAENTELETTESKTSEFETSEFETSEFENSENPDFESSGSGNSQNPNLESSASDNTENPDLDNTGSDMTEIDFGTLLIEEQASNGKVSEFETLSYSGREYTHFSITHHDQLVQDFYLRKVSHYMMVISFTHAAVSEWHVENILDTLTYAGDLE